MRIFGAFCWTQYHFPALLFFYPEQPSSSSEACFQAAGALVEFLQTNRNTLDSGQMGKFLRLVHFFFDVPVFSFNEKRIQAANLFSLAGECPLPPLWNYLPCNYYCAAFQWIFCFQREGFKTLYTRSWLSWLLLHSDCSGDCVVFVCPMKFVDCGVKIHSFSHLVTLGQSWTPQAEPNSLNMCVILLCCIKMCGITHSA